jgi:hypothetical protein
MIGFDCIEVMTGKLTAPNKECDFTSFMAHASSNY